MVDEIANWLSEQNATIKKFGRGLTDREQKIANRLRIQEPVFVLEVSQIIFPSWIDDLAATFGLHGAAGFTCDHGILAARAGLDLIAHELVHVLQRERYPSLKAFVGEYLSQCQKHGYTNAPFEVEARQIQNQYK